MANRVRRNSTDDSEFVRAKSEYSNYLLRTGYNIGSIDNERVSKCSASISRNFSM